MFKNYWKRHWFSSTKPLRFHTNPLPLYHQAVMELVDHTVNIISKIFYTQETKHFSSYCIETYQKKVY